MVSHTKIGEAAEINQALIMAIRQLSVWLGARTCLFAFVGRTPTRRTTRFGIQVKMSFLFPLGLLTDHDQSSQVVLIMKDLRRQFMEPPRKNRFDGGETVGRNALTPRRIWLLKLDGIMAALRSSLRRSFQFQPRQ